MKLQLDAVLTDADDKPITENDVPVSTLTVLKRAILADTTDVAEKLSRFELFLKLKFATIDTHFDLQEINLLDKAVMVFPTLIAGQLHYILTQK